jgi:hypothetical protein
VGNSLQLIPTDEGGCDDSNPCTNDYCDQLNGCVNVNNLGATCSFGQQCQIGLCVLNPVTDVAECLASIVSGLPCDDANQCTGNDTCTAVDSGIICQGDPTVDNGNTCDDNNECTVDDMCNAGVCAGTNGNDGEFCENFDGPMDCSDSDNAVCGNGVCKSLDPDPSCLGDCCTVNPGIAGCDNIFVEDYICVTLGLASCCQTGDPTTLGWNAGCVTALSTSAFYNGVCIE